MALLQSIMKVTTDNPRIFKKRRESIMPELVVLILAKNEEKNIADVIENAQRCSKEIIIIDSGSTDNTVGLAEALGARVVFRAWDNDFAAQRNFALSQTDAEWVLYLDADERLNADLISAIKSKMTNPELKQYKIVRKSVAFGHKFNYGVLRPDFVTRLFPREKVEWVNKVHERPICSLPEETLNGYIEHFTYEGWSQYLQKLDQYTTIWSNDAYKNGKRTSLANAFAHATSGFLQMAFFKKGVLDGWLGLALCCNHFIYVLLKYLKLHELRKKAET